MPVSADDLAFLADKLWSSGTQGRTRTNRLRADPRCTLYVYDSGELVEAAFLQTMRDEGRLIYEFEITKSYGLH